MLQEIVEAKNMANNAHVFSGKVGSVISLEDEEDQKFEKHFKLWMENKISYQELVDNFPYYDESKIRRLLKALIKRFDQ
jgi:F0F1-type ATP synthase delta subunit